jgi:hypothetical protein
VTRETIDDRWQTLVIGPDGHGRAGSSELYERLTGAVAELAVRMVHGIRDEGREEDSLITLTCRVGEWVEEEVKAFAMEIETGRRVTVDRGRVPDAARSR